ncbi:aldo/keto reductase [Peribacillus loiseleuriae]|uniref:aldo/keto reductase n=1 Tax=Peribacillus loiseleuriae TaxID=1679170 RepID=UPI0037F411A9
MKYMIVKGLKDGQPIDIKCSQLVMGSGDFLRADNMEFSALILNKFIEIGGNTFDTARQYRHSELALAKWMGMRQNRESITILTKCCHPTRDEPNKPRVTPEAITEDLMESLEKLNTNYVDLYALHRDDPNVEVGPIMEALTKHVRAGRIHAIGTSNWHLDRIIEANNYARENGLLEFTFNSPNLSLAKCKRPRWEGCVSVNQEMVEWHETTNMPLFSWSSQAGGFFSGRFTPNNLENQEMVEVYYNEENWMRYERAEKLAEEKDVSTIQVALSYVLNQKFPTAAVIGPEKIEELLSSYEGSELFLSEDEVNWLDLKK